MRYVRGLNVEWASGSGGGIATDFDLAVGMRGAGTALCAGALAHRLQQIVRVASAGARSVGGCTHGGVRSRPCTVGRKLPQVRLCLVEFCILLGLHLVALFVSGR